MIRKTVVAFVLALLLAAQPLLAAEAAGSKSEPKADPDHKTMSVEDLGFSQDQIKSDPQYQKDLQARSDMLQIHQTLGLITAVPMTTEYVLGIITAGNVANGSKDTALHATLGTTTAALYTATALFAILAPKPKGIHSTGNTKTHADLAWIHAPLMIAVPVLGSIANNQVQNGQPLGGLGVAHGILATALVLSYLTSLTVITF